MTLTMLPTWICYILDSYVHDFVKTLVLIICKAFQALGMSHMT